MGKRDETLILLLVLTLIFASILNVSRYSIVGSIIVIVLAVAFGAPLVISRFRKSPEEKAKLTPSK